MKCRLNASNTVYDQDRLNGEPQECPHCGGHFYNKKHDPILGNMWYCFCCDCVTNFAIAKAGENPDNEVNACRHLSGPAH